MQSLGEAFDAIPATAAVLDGDGVITAVNRAWRLFASLNGGDTDTCGIGAHYLATCRQAAAAGAPGAAAVCAGLEALLGPARQPFEHEYPCDGPGTPRWFLLQAAPLPSGAGAVLTHLDITRRKLLQDRLTYLAEHDGLTGLLNRHGIDRALATLAAGSGSVLICDLDGFKAVNDHYGHVTGDEVLVHVAARLQRVAAGAVGVGRLGGDEFAVVTSDPPAATEALAQAIDAALRGPYQVGHHQVQLGCSVGWAALVPGERVNDVLRRADLAMYAVKGGCAPAVGAGRLC